MNDILTEAIKEKVKTAKSISLDELEAEFRDSPSSSLKHFYFSIKVFIEKIYHLIKTILKNLFKFIFHK